ncbi:hypothetical protein DFH06DRAFT_1376404, partial [Mycena polygramma]
FPLLLTQVDSGHPNTVFGQYPKKHTASVGTVYPEVRHISTVAQFRAIDYGMQICEVHVNLEGSSSSSFALYRLEGTVALDSLQLSFNSRPRRALMLSEIEANPDGVAQFRRNFSCESEQLLTFELACAKDSPTGCFSEWWQDSETARSPGD